MCVDCVLASPRIAQVDPGNGPLLEVVLSQTRSRSSSCAALLVVEPGAQDHRRAPLFLFLSWALKIVVLFHHE
jgi:hypothetical protein